MSTLSSFKKPPATQPRGVCRDEAEGAALVAAWANALSAALATSPEPAFELEAYKLELSPGAAFVHFRDPSGAMDHLRTKVLLSGCRQLLRCAFARVCVA